VADRNQTIVDLACAAEEAAALVRSHRHSDNYRKVEPAMVARTVAQRKFTDAVRAEVKRRAAYVCGVCGDPILPERDGDPHTVPETGDDCHETCCPECAAEVVGG
jgi:hypothetical protein